MAPPHVVYAEQLHSLHHGHPQWYPEPEENKCEVLIGDVGFFEETGRFFRLFNALATTNDLINKVFGVPECFEPLDINKNFVVHSPNAMAGEQVLCSKSIKSSQIELSGQA